MCLCDGCWPLQSDPTFAGADLERVYQLAELSQVTSQHIIERHGTPLHDLERACQLSLCSR